MHIVIVVNSVYEDYKGYLFLSLHFLCVELFFSVEMNYICSCKDEEEGRTR